MLEYGGSCQKNNARIIVKRKVPFTRVLVGVTLLWRFLVEIGYFKLLKCRVVIGEMMLKCMFQMEYETNKLYTLIECMLENHT